MRLGWVKRIKRRASESFYLDLFSAKYGAMLLLLPMPEFRLVSWPCLLVTALSGHASQTHRTLFFFVFFILFYFSFFFVVCNWPNKAFDFSFRLPIWHLVCTWTDLFCFSFSLVSPTATKQVETCASEGYREINNKVSAKRESHSRLLVEIKQQQQ